MHVSELADCLTVSADTVRYYTRIGFLSPRQNPSNHYKEYGAQEKERLNFILSARQLGFSVSDIRQLLEQADTGKTACPMARRLIERRLQQTEERFQETILLREKMKLAIRDWASKPDKDPSDHMICHLIEGSAPTNEVEI